LNKLPEFSALKLLKIEFSVGTRLISFQRIV
jgi:hypothetical protein